MIKTAVIGASGYVGGHLWRAYREGHPGSVGTGFSSLSNSELLPFDIRRPDPAIASKLVASGHEAVLIASAKPNIAFCEQNPEAAYEVNVKGTLELIGQLGRLGLHVIFLSSDYVFEGKGGPYDDSATPAPSTEYGRQKALVEREIGLLAPRFTVMRLSKIYGIEKGDNTLLDEMAAALAAGRQLRAAKDQIFCPTFVHDLVKAVLASQAAGLEGHLNVCNPARWSRADIALELATAMNVSRNLVSVISLYDIPSMAGRPLDTSMACSTLIAKVRPTFVSLHANIEKVARAWSRDGN